MLRVELDIIAPIPVGHHVTLVPLETRHTPLLGGEVSWSPTKQMIVCDDETRIVYTARGVGTVTMTYDAIAFAPDSTVRISPTLPALRGRVRSCVVRTDWGDSVRMETVLLIEPDPGGYR